MDQSLGIILIDALIVVEMEELDLIKVFLLFNKHALNVQEVVKKLLILVEIVVVKEIDRQQKKFQ